jgi:YVTN family beta-propeller protein
VTPGGPGTQPRRHDVNPTHRRTPASHAVPLMCAILITQYLTVEPAMAQRAWLVRSESGTVSAIDTAHDSVITEISVGGNPVAIAVTPDGKKVYVVSDYLNTVSVIGAASNTVIATIPVSGTSIAFAPPSAR